jgi:hypothetical protein
MRSQLPKIAVCLVASLAVIGTIPTAAGAQDCVVPSPTQDQYCPPVPPPSVTTEEGSGPSASSGGGGLPFTGYDLGLAALVSVALVGAGFGLRRAARADEAA